MRRALTLIELILSMVIIAIVFTVIPRLIHAMNQTSKTAQQEEAMYNAVALMGAIINLPWDNNNTQHDQILQVTQGNSAYDCNTTSGYRIGGFIGGRNCIEPSGVDYNATTLGLEGTDINDIDDYISPVNVDNNCSRSHGKFLYTLTPVITYVTDPLPTSAISLSDVNLSGTAKSNTKHILVKVGYHTDNKLGGCITALQYDAFNIGQIHINSRSW
jgi:prepilin-type N-terminal cleavage/methylation domain-containing protein